MKSQWNNNFAFRLPTPVWAPPGEGNGNESELEDELEIEDVDPFENGNQEDDDSDSDTDDELSLDGDKFLSKLFEDDEDDPDNNSDPDSDSDAGDSEEEQERLANSMKSNIAAIGIPEKAIPDNFDPSDPKQFREVVGAIQRQTVQDTIRIIWEPVAAAMRQTHVRMRAEMQEAVQLGVGENNISSLLAKEIPNYNSPGIRDVVKTVLKKAQAKHKNPEKAVQATKKALQAMGLRIGGSRSGQSGNRSSSSARQRTNDVLDSFAKLPTMSSSKPGNRLENRLRRPAK